MEEAERFMKVILPEQRQVLLRGTGTANTIQGEKMRQTKRSFFGCRNGPSQSPARALSWEFE